MAVTFVLGRAGAGKTRYCLDAILADLSRSASGERLIFIVPEQASFQMERKLATRSPRGGYSRAAVLSFSRLASEALEQSGAGDQVLSSHARRFALRHVVDRQRAKLHVLRRAADTPGFVIQLERWLEELLREGISIDDLRESIARLGDAAATEKLGELTDLYAAYVAWLGEGRVDPAARLAELRTQLASITDLDGARVWVDGFAGFTGQELETLVAIAQRARSLTITLLLDPASSPAGNDDDAPAELRLFHRTEQTYRTLTRLLIDAGAEVTADVALTPPRMPRYQAAPALAKLEATLAQVSAGPSVDVAADDRTVTLYECATPRDELLAAAHWIRRSIANGNPGLRFRDFAVIARGLESLAATVREVFAEFELPYFLDRRRTLMGHPLCRWCEAVFDVVQSDFAPEPMSHLLRTQLVPLDRAQRERLENLTLRHNVGGYKFWQRARWQLEEAHAAGAPLDGGRLTLVGALVPLNDLAVESGDATGRAWAECLYAASEKMGLRATLASWIERARQADRHESAETHRLAWDAFCEVLSDLADVLGDMPLSAADVAALLVGTLRERTVGLAPPTLDQVLVSSIERSRHPDIKCAWVVGLNEGVFPARSTDTGLLNTSQREALRAAGLTRLHSPEESALNERLLGYIAFTRPSRELVLSYARTGQDGQTLQPSPLLVGVRAALPNLTVTRPDESPATLSELAHAYLASQPRGDNITAATVDRIRTASTLASRLNWLLRGIEYANAPPPVRRRGNDAHVIWNTSPSEIEEYLKCPFRHFAKHDLRLDTERGPRPLRWDLGSIAHDVLAVTVRRAIESSTAIRDLTLEQWREFLVSAARDHEAGLSDHLDEQRPDLAFYRRALFDRLRETLTAHVYRWGRGDFTPALCEQRFGTDGDNSARPPIVVWLNGDVVHVRGQIDRIDVCEVGGKKLALIYDYKSGRSAVGPVAGKYLTGGRLQLFLYQLAVEQWGVFDAAGVLLAPLFPDLGVLERAYAAGADEGTLLMYMYRPRGMFTETAAKSLDRSLSHESSPVAQMRKTKKDDSFDAYSDACAPSALAAYGELAERTVAFAAEAVRAGRVDIAPLVEHKTLACKTCDFRAVCRFDRAFNRPRAAEAALPTLDTPNARDGGDT